MLGFKLGHVCKQETEHVNCQCFKEVNSKAFEDHRGVVQNDISDAELLDFVRGMFYEMGDEGNEEERDAYQAWKKTCRQWMRVRMSSANYRKISTCLTFFCR